jgi:hypothetical protein
MRGRLPRLLLMASLRLADNTRRKDERAHSFALPISLNCRLMSGLERDRSSLRGDHPKGAAINYYFAQRSPINKLQAIDW